MPAPLELTGRRFGRLLVQGRDDDVISSTGKSRRAAWQCLCDCGNTEVLTQDKLLARGYVECAQCRQHNCVVCGAKVPLDRGHKNTCCDAHEAEKIRAVQMEHYYRTMTADPEHNQKARAAQRARAEKDPAYAQLRAAQLAEQERRRWERKKADPAALASESQRRRAWYAANADRVQAKRRERVEAMSPEEYERWAEIQRAGARRYYERNRDDLAWLARRREYMREYLRQQALRGLVAAGDELMRRSLTDE